MLRQFAALCFVFFVGIGVWQALVSGRTTAGIVLACLGVLLGLLGLVSLRVLKPIFVGWMILAFPIGLVISNIIMSLIYFGVLTPIGLVLRSRGRDALRVRRSGPEVASYWETRTASTDIRRYFKMY
jgi:hypothetical protein